MRVCFYPLGRRGRLDECEKTGGRLAAPHLGGASGAARTVDGGRRGHGGGVSTVAVPTSHEVRRADHEVRRPDHEVRRADHEAQTYAVVLYFDEETEDRLLALWAALDVHGVDSAARTYGAGYRPHLTLSIIETDETEETERVIDALETPLAEVTGLPVTLASLGFFVPYPCPAYLAVTPTSRLLALHEQVYDALDLPCWDHYRPGSWMPHCTLAMRVDLTSPVAHVVSKTALPIHASVSTAWTSGYLRSPVSSAGSISLPKNVPVTLNVTDAFETNNVYAAEVTITGRIQKPIAAVDVALADATLPSVTSKGDPVVYHLDGNLLTAYVESGDAAESEEDRTAREAAMLSSLGQHIHSTDPSKRSAL